MKKNHRISYLINLLKTNKSAVLFSCLIFFIVSTFNLIASYSIKYLIDIGIIEKNITILIIFSIILILSQALTIILRTAGLNLSERAAHKILYSEKKELLEMLYIKKQIDLDDLHPAEFKLLLTSYIDDLKFFSLIFLE